MTRAKFAWSLLLILAGGRLLGVPEAGATEFVVESGGDIAAALDQAQPGDIVRLQDGVYRQQGLMLPDGVIILSTYGHAESVSIIGDGSAPVLICTGVSRNAQVIGITITCDPMGPGPVRGGGLFCAEASPTILDCRFEGLTATYGGAVYCRDGSRPLFSGCVFNGNHARAIGGAMACVDESRPVLMYCLVAGNSAGAAAGAFNAANDSHVALDHCTVTDNLQPGDPDPGPALAFWNASGDTLAGTILVDDDLWVGDHGSGLRADCSDVFNGGQPVPVDPAYGSFISEDPLFCTTLAGDHYYNLEDASPCTPEAAPGCGGMGARPPGCALSPVPDQPPASEILPAVTRLREAYPNPFNPRTTINFDVARTGRVTVAVFDVAGRLVRRLRQGTMPAGSHQVTWQGDGRDGRQVAAGIYFVQLKTDDIIDSRRITLVK